MAPNDNPDNNAERPLIPSEVIEVGQEELLGRVAGALENLGVDPSAPSPAAEESRVITPAEEVAPLPSRRVPQPVTETPSKTDDLSISEAAAKVEDAYVQETTE